MSANSISKLLIASVVTACSLSANAAHKNHSSWKSKIFDNKNYVRVGGTLSDVQKYKKSSNMIDKPDATWAVDLGLEREVCSRLKLGLDYQYKHSNKSTSNGTSTASNRITWGYKSHTAMARASYDLVDMSKFTPYLFAGAGASLMESLDYKLVAATGTVSTWKKKSKTNFAWKTGFGLRMKSWKKVDTFLEYAYQDQGFIHTKNQKLVGSTVTTEPAKKGRAVSHNITAGIAINF